MSFEKFPKTQQTESRSKEEELDNLYARLPSDLREMWEERLEGKSVTEQIQKLTELLVKRKGNDDNRVESRLMPKGVEIFQSFPDDLRQMIETLKTGKQTIELGYGQAGHVIANIEEHPDTCYKLLFDYEKLPLATNDIAVETELQKEIGTLLDGKHGVLVPHVYGFISEPGTRAITMELMNAPSLRKVVERRKESMPDAFDFDTFFGALEAFVKEMHALGYYHRDLHWGNVLVHRETGMPCLIDFGLTKYAPIEDGDVYRERVPVSGQIEEVVLKSDEVNLEEMKRQVQAYLDLNSGAI